MEMTKTKAKLSHAKISAQKLRLVANQIRGLGVEEALNILRFSNKKAAKIIAKVLNSAVANAENNDGTDIDELIVVEIFIDEGPTVKRMKPRAKGRSDRILKRTSHISVTVAQK